MAWKSRSYDDDPPPVPSAVGTIGLAAVTASLTTLLIVWMLGGGPW